MKLTSLFFLSAILLLVNVLTAAGQSNVNTRKLIVDTLKLRDTTKKPTPNKDKKSPATVRNKSVVTGIDTTKKLRDTTKKSKSDLEDVLESHAQDTIRYSDDYKTIYLINKARINYNGIQLDADYIEVNTKTKIIFARGKIDPKTRKYVGRPISKQGKDEPITADSIRFNYQTKLAHAWNSYTRQEENYLSGGQEKKISEDEIAIQNKIFTTCDKPDHPDFGIVITKGIVEKKRIIAGPAYLEIEGVPIPIAIPFGFFPKMDTRTSGLILPTFGEDQRLGFFLRNFGYYLGLSDYADLTTMGTYFSNGSYEVNTSLNYRDRYKYNGNLVLSYGSHNTKLQGDPPNRDFNITWSHSQNPTAHPGTTFSASVNAGTSTFFQNNANTVGYNLQALTQNNLRSSISYGRVWTGTPFALNVSLGHSQDLTRKTVTLDLPTFNFSMATISPFDSKKRVTQQKWYQKITIGYTLTGTNKINAVPESELFTQKTLTKRMQNGMQHQIPIGLNLNVLNYLQFNASVNYTDRWYFQTIRKRYGRADSLITDTIPGFQRVGEYSASAGFSTKVYSILNFKSGKIKAIRHVMTPTLSFNYRPNYSSSDYSFNRSIVSNATIPYPVVSQRYSIFEQSIFGGPGGGRQAGLAFNLDNTLEAKVRPKSTDTSATDKKIMLLQSLNVSTFYNFAADSFKLSQITVSGHTNLFNNRVNVSFGAVFNPYTMRVIDSISNGQLVRTARPVDRLSFLDGHFPLLQSFSLSASTSLNSSAFKPKPVQPIPGAALRNMNAQQAEKLALLNSDPSAYVDFNIPWNLVLNYSFTYANSVTSTTTANTLMVSGDVNLTKKWKVQFSSNVDLKLMKVSSATSFSIYRDLHCWDLAMQWLPFGYYKSYNVTLRVKSTILQDLKLSKRSDYTGGQYYR